MGVSGSGKTTIGKLLAERFSLRFFDGDDYHSKNNVQKMSRGEPLTDEDREDWLASLAELIQSERPIVLACSALKTEYREYLSESDIGLRFVFLDVPFEVAKTDSLQGRVISCQFLCLIHSLKHFKDPRMLFIFKRKNRFSL